MFFRLFQQSYTRQMLLNSNSVWVRKRALFKDVQWNIYFSMRLRHGRCFFWQCRNTIKQRKITFLLFSFWKVDYRINQRWQQQVGVLLRLDSPRGWCARICTRGINISAFSADGGLVGKILVSLWQLIRHMKSRKLIDRNRSRPAVIKINLQNSHQLVPQRCLCHVCQLLQVRLVVIYLWIRVPVWFPVWLLYDWCMIKTVFSLKYIICLYLKSVIFAREDMPIQRTWTILWYGQRKQVVGCTEMTETERIKWKSCNLHSDDWDLSWNAVFFREVCGESHSTKLRICKLSLNLISSSGRVFLRPQERWSVGKLPAGIDGQSEPEKVTHPPSEAAKRQKLRMVFPQQKHFQGEQRESITTHLLCRRRNDVPECSLADLWPPCGVLLIHFHLHTCFGGPLRVQESRWRKCACCKSCCCVLRLRINYTCGMWASDWHEYFTAFNQSHCQSDGASGCVTWVIKDAVSYAHAAVSEVVSAVRDRGTLGVY